MGFLLLSLEPSEARVRRALSEWNLQGRVAIATGEVLAPLSVREVPSTVFVDAQGNLVASASGARSRDFLEKRARELLDSSR